MKATKIGIWMDYSHAHLTEFTVDPMTTHEIMSSIDHHAVAESQAKAEHHGFAQHERAKTSYFKQLKDVIMNYQGVLLFGPTHAKTELLNEIRTNPHFGKNAIEVLDTDKMSRGEEHAFVKSYFSKHSALNTLK